MPGSGDVIHISVTMHRLVIKGCGHEMALPKAMCKLLHIMVWLFVTTLLHIGVFVTRTLHSSQKVKFNSRFSADGVSRYEDKNQHLNQIHKLCTWGLLNGQQRYSHAILEKCLPYISIIEHKTRGMHFPFDFISQCEASKW